MFLQASVDAYLCTSWVAVRTRCFRVRFSGKQVGKADEGSRVYAESDLRRGTSRS